MIYSEKNNYLFVELPHTASTAISRELRDLYDGKAILRKHAFYHEFVKNYNSDPDKLFIFSGIRNPMDEVVSIYFKYKTDHLGTVINKDDPNKRIENVSRAARKRYIFTKENSGFDAYLKKFYKVPYDNWSSLDHKKFNYVMRFEDLQDEFKRVLDLIGIQQVRPLPFLNKTREKKDYLSYYSPEIRQHAKYVFCPFMKRWNYDFPSEWNDYAVPWSSEILFRLVGAIRKMYWKHLYKSSSTGARILLSIFGR